jgi:hypothetical protein
MGSETSCGRQGRVARQRADPCVGFIVTNLAWQARKVGKFVAPVERRSNGSKRARMPAGGLGSPARPSGQTTLVCNSLPWRPNSGTSSAGWHFQSASGSGRDHAEGEARQDRCQCHPARQVRDVPAGGSRRAPPTLRFDPRTGSADFASRPLCVRPVGPARPGEIEQEVTGVREGAALHPWRKRWNSILEADQTPLSIAPAPPLLTAWRQAGTLSGRPSVLKLFGGW